VNFSPFAAISELMNNWIIRKAQELMVQGVPFALATVVRRERPTSSEPGDKAIITADGDLMGWVGGSCAQPTVIKEAQGAIADGEPRLVVITPNLAEQAREGEVLYPMSCYSGGTLEIHIEPYLPEPQLVVCGASPAAEALVKIGKTVGFQVVLIDPSAAVEKFASADVVLPRLEKEKLPPCRERYAVVATMGNWDEQAVLDLLAMSPDYIGVIASKKRFRQMMQGVRPDGISQERLESIRCPAGIDMPVRTLQEIALSVIAEIVSIRRSRAQHLHSTAPQSTTTARMAEDPVCHMTVDAATARTMLEFDGVVYYFCSPHCKTIFEKDPRGYVSVEAKA
jgi:xanthine dehydrogenase accessory factor